MIYARFQMIDLIGCRTDESMEGVRRNPSAQPILISPAFSPNFVRARELRIFILNERNKPLND